VVDTFIGISFCWAKRRISLRAFVPFAFVRCYEEMRSIITSALWLGLEMKEGTGLVRPELSLKPVYLQEECFYFVVCCAFFTLLNVTFPPDLISFASNLPSRTLGLTLSR